MALFYPRHEKMSGDAVFMLRIERDRDGKIGFLFVEEDGPWKR